MNKFLFVVLALVAITASAEDLRNFAKVEAVSYSYDSAPNDKYGVNLQVGREVAPGIKLDVKQEFRIEENTQKTSNRIELGGAYEEKIPFVKVGTRVAVGEKYTSGDAYEYFLIEPFVAYDLTDNVTLKGSYRYRNAFDSDKLDRTNTYKLNAAYKYTSNLYFDATLGQTYGNSEYTAVQGGVTYKF